MSRRISTVQTMSPGNSTLLFEQLELLGISTPNVKKVVDAQVVCARYLETKVASICKANILKNDMKEEGADVQYDEQHSRPQRQHGRAAFCSAVFQGPDAEILHIEHVNDEITKAHGCLDKGKASRELGMHKINNSFFHIAMVTGDGCTGGEKSFREFILPYHTGVIFNHDVWHVTKGVRTSYKSMVNKRKALRKPFWCPIFQEHIYANKLARHFTFCIEKMAEAQGDTNVFKQMWIGGLMHWVEKYRVSRTSEEFIKLKKWFKEQLPNIGYVAYNKSTSLCEAFHSLAVLYCPKNLNLGFRLYCIKKNFAVVHWHNARTMQRKENVWKKEVLQEILAEWETGKN